jgi:hypothetical protein
MRELHDYQSKAVAQLASRKMWTMRNGKRIAIADMADRHLRNTLRFLRRHSDYLVIHYLRETAKMRSNMGEYAQDAFEEGAVPAADGSDHARCMFAYDKYRALYAEAQKRWGEETEQMLADTTEQDRTMPDKKQLAVAKPKMTEEQRLSGLLWTFTDLKVVKTEFVATAEGTYRLTFEDGRTLVFSACGDDATYCSMEIEKP